MHNSLSYNMKLVQIFFFSILAVDPYCIIEVEGTKITTPVVKNELNPKYNYGGLFYVKNPADATIHIMVCGMLY